MNGIRIGIEGMGQMGSFYLENLRKLEFGLANIIVWDISEARLASIREKYPDVRIADSFEQFAASADAFIVAVNTPAHHEEIEKLAAHGARQVLCESGTQHILCEKPLAQNLVSLRKIRALERRFSQLNVYTALVIGFSPARVRLTSLMRDEGLVLRTFGGRWGKNRGKTSEKRPTAGDRVDEFVHMTEFGLGLMREQGIQYVDVIAQVEYLAYANDDVQREAHEQDASYPIRPDHSTQALLCATTASGSVVQMSLASSFLEAKQVRTVWGTLTKPDSDEPVYSFSIDFDVKGADLLTLTHVRTDTVTEEAIGGDKLMTLTECFLQCVQGEAADDRLATVEWAGVFVELMEAIGKSDELRRAAKPRECRVEFPTRQMLSSARA